MVVHPDGAADGGFSVMAERSDDASGRWTADVDAADGDHYWLVVDDGPPLLDPHCPRRG